MKIINRRVHGPSAAKIVYTVLTQNRTPALKPVRQLLYVEPGKRVHIPDDEYFLGSKIHYQLFPNSLELICRSVTVFYEPNQQLLVFCVS